jgi:hypothetical protein
VPSALSQGSLLAALFIRRKVLHVEQLKVSSAEEIATKMKELFDAEAAEKKKDIGELVPLPKSGLVVRMRRKNMDEDVLTALPLGLVVAMQGRDSTDGDTPDAELSPEDLKENARGLIYFRETVTENCLEPRVAKDGAGRVCFVDLETGKVLGRIHPDDFLFMFEWITGQKGNDGLEKFRNRAQRRASTTKSRGKTLRPRPVGTAMGQPASA